MHAMPVMLGVLAILAVAYRYYSAFLAAQGRGARRLADDARAPVQRRAELRPDEPLGALRPPLRGDLGGGAADRAGAGDPVRLHAGAGLAGRRRLPGRRRAGHDGPGRLGPPRRPEPRRPGAAARSDRPAGVAAAIAILYIIIIALAGLGIVVVKALGGEEVPMKAGTVLVYPEQARRSSSNFAAGKPRTYNDPPRHDLPLRRRAGPEHGLPRGFELAVPSGLARSEAAPTAAGLMLLPAGARRLVPGSSWGTFTIACTIPIALFVGWYMYRFRKGKVVEASLIGAAAVLAATVAGALDPGLAARAVFLAVARRRPIFAIAAYGFVASVLPVWLLLCPATTSRASSRSARSRSWSCGVIVANPKLEAPAVNPHFAAGGGPNFDGPIFPYVFICIMCGAISGFHALVSSGTTPKMVDKEGDVRMIGYGAMLMEGLVGVVALIAAAALPNSMYYDINIDLADGRSSWRITPTSRSSSRSPRPTSTARPAGMPTPRRSPLAAMEQDVQESLHGRTGGAVTLAVGMARIFTDALPGHAMADQVLVSLRDHVRGAVHPDDDRRRHADRPVPGAGVPRQALEAAGRPRTGCRPRSWRRAWSSSAGATSSTPARSTRSGRCSAWPTSSWP